MNAMPLIGQDRRERSRNGYDAIIITDTNMCPAFPINSVAFLGESQYSSAFLFYAVYRDGECAGIYRVKRCKAGVSFSLDNWPSHDQPLFVVPIEEVRSMDLRLVEGFARPFTSKFGRFLADRFRTLEG